MKRLEEMEIVSIYESPDESTTDLICGLLEAEGIKTIVHKHERMLEAALCEEPGFWGEIRVQKNDAERALQIIEIYKNEKRLNDSKPNPEGPEP